MDIMNANMQAWALMSPSGDYYKISEPNFFIGREDGLDLTLKSRSVDKRHAVIAVQGNRHEIHDLGSLNGTFVNEKRIKLKKPILLELTDTVRFGYAMILLCVRVCSGKEVVFGPKWIGIEEDRTLSDLLRCATGDQFTTKNIQVVVSSETSVKDVACVSLTAPVTDLEDKDTKLVNYVLQPDEKTVEKKMNTYRIDLYPQESPKSFLETLIDENHNQQVPPKDPYDRKSYDSHEEYYPQQRNTQTTCSNEDPGGGREPTPSRDVPYHMHHPPSYPMHPQAVPLPAHYPPHGYSAPLHAPVPPRQPHCTCPHCTMGAEPHSPRSSPADHVAPAYYGYHGYPYYDHAAMSSGHIRPNIERPMSVHGDRYDSMIKGTHYQGYGQPPWWGWGAPEGNTHPSTGPHAALSARENTEGGATQAMIALHQQKLRNERTASPQRHSITSMAVLQEPQEKIYTQMAPVAPHLEHDYHTVSAMNGRGRSEPLSSMYERSPSTGEWEYLRQRSRELDQGLQFEDCEDDENTSIIRRGRQTPQAMSFEIPMIPEYGEIPEKPVSERSNVRRSEGSAKPDKRSIIRSRTITKSKHQPRPMSDTETVYKNKKHSARRFSGASAISDTSESECERSFRARRIPESRVFGLTEVSLDQITDKSQVLPKWVEHWARSMQSGNGTENGRTRTRGSSTTADSTSDSRASTPRTPRSSTSTLNRSHSGDTPEQKHSDPKAATLPRNFRSRTSGVPRLRMSTGSDADSKRSQRSRGMVSSTSDDSEGERSDTSFSSNHFNRTSGYSTPERDHSIGSRRSTRPTSAPVTLPRGNKTTMLRALNSREAIKSGSAKNTSKTKHRHSTGGGNGLSGDEKLTSSNTSSRWSHGSKKSSKSPTTSGGLRKGERRVPGVEDMPRVLSQSDRETQAAVEALFSSSTRASLHDDFQSSRGEKTNKTFVLEDGVQPTRISPSDEKPPKRIENGKDTPLVSHDHESDTLSSSSSDIDKVALIKALTELQTDKSSHPASTEWSKTHDTKIQPEKLVSDRNNPAPRWSVSPESKPKEMRPVSPDSLISVPPATSPSPPSTPRTSAQKTVQGRNTNLSASLSRRQWDVAEKPVEDLMLASIHAFTVELRLASESALSKVRTLYGADVDGSINVSNENSTKIHTSNSTPDKDHQSSIPDWKSSHAEIAGVFRNLRHVEFSLRTMDQALSVLCTNSSTDANKERKLSMIEETSKSPHKWNDFRVRARKDSWAVEHRNQFPGTPSDDEDDDS